MYFTAYAAYLSTNLSVLTGKWVAVEMGGGRCCN